MTAKKRIVAMVLALSVFSSTFGMIGAAAADAESLETPEKPAFTVTVVSAQTKPVQAATATPPRRMHLQRVKTRTVSLHRAPPILRAPALRAAIPKAPAPM